MVLQIRASAAAQKPHWPPLFATDLRLKPSASVSFWQLLEQTERKRKSILSASSGDTEPAAGPCCELLREQRQGSHTVHRLVEFV